MIHSAITRLTEAMFRNPPNMEAEGVKRVTAMSYALLHKYYKDFRSSNPELAAWDDVVWPSHRGDFHIQNQWHGKSTGVEGDPVLVARTYLPLDLDGWMASEEEVIDILPFRYDPRIGDPVNVLLYPQMEKGKSAGGKYHRDLRAVNVNLPAHPEKPVSAAIKHAQSVFRHEFLHWSQDILGAVKQLQHGKAGLPPDDLRHPGPPNRRETPHSLRDGEFYPNIQTAIDKYQDLLDKYNLEDSQILRRVYVGDNVTVPRSILGAVNTLADLESDFFLDLLDMAPDRWKKAVKVFMKELNRLL